MSKYVNHKHGLVLGSGNVFFITHDEDAPEGVEQFRDGYRAIVWARGYRFETISTLNCMIYTPVQQLLWQRKESRKEIEFEGKKYPEFKFYSELKHWPRIWLDKNVGGIHKMWDVRTREEARESGCVFFKRRKDALAFINAISNVLEGIQISD